MLASPRNPAVAQAVRPAHKSRTCLHARQSAARTPAHWVPFPCSGWQVPLLQAWTGERLRITAPLSSHQTHTCQTERAVDLLLMKGRKVEPGTQCDAQIAFKLPYHHITSTSKWSPNNTILVISHESVALDLLFIAAHKYYDQ